MAVSEKRRAELTLCLSVFISLVGIGIVVPLFPVFVTELGASAVWIGAVFTAFALSRTIFMPLFGRLSDSFEKKNIIAAGAFLYAIISLGYVIADDVVLLTTVRFVHGIASAMIAPVAMAYLGEIAGIGREGRTMARYQASILFGFGAGPFIGGAIYVLYGYDAAFYTLAAISAIAFLVLVAFLPGTKQVQAEDKGSGASEKKKKNLLSAARVLAGTPLYLGVFLLTMALEFGMVGIIVFLPLYAGSVGLTPFSSGLLISVNFFASATLQMTFGWIADRFRRTRLVIAGAAVIGLSFILVTSCTGLTQLLIILVINAFGFFMVMPAINAYMVGAGRITGMGKAMGIYNFVRGAGGIISPVIGGMVVDSFGIAPLFSLTGALIIFSGAGFVILARISGKNEKNPGV